MFEMADVTIIRGQKTAVLVRLKWVLVRHWQLLSNAVEFFRAFLGFRKIISFALHLLQPSWDPIGKLHLSSPMCYS